MTATFSPDQTFGLYEAGTVTDGTNVYKSLQPIGLIPHTSSSASLAFNSSSNSQYFFLLFAW